METTRESMLSEQLRPWVPLMTAAVVPVFVLPVAIWGVRAMRPRLLRSAVSGAISLGMLSLVGLAARGARQLRPPAPREPGERWHVPFTGPMAAEDVGASAMSGH